jgi:hypothetical protein
MGALSSFAIFDLSHHILVQVAAMRAGYNEYFDRYTIIGDDIAIADQKVAQRYMELMPSLGVAVNLSKSLIHDETLLVAGEIAKRLYVQGDELSSIPVKLLAKLPRFGKLAPLVQDFMVSRGALQQNDSVLKFLVSAVDRDSMVNLLKINAVPSGISGLGFPVGPYADNLKVSNWTQIVQLEDQDIIDAYTFTLISEQLKRMEALLRQSEILEDTFRLLKERRIANQGTLPGMLAGDFFIRLSTYLGPIDNNHPIYHAAAYEAVRIGKLLASLRAGSASLSSVARSGLVDSLRNSIWVKGNQTEEERGQVMYSVFMNAVSNIDRMLDQPGKDSKGNPITRGLEFTIPVLQLSRSYTVYWKFRGGVYVNMVRSRISPDLATNVTRLNSLTDSVSILKPRKPIGS